MKTIISKTINTSGHFVYWHRHVVTGREIRIAASQGFPIEIDIAFDHTRNRPFIGHPYEFYSEVKKKPLPQNISFDLLCRCLEKEKNLYVVIDCKDEKIFPYLKKLIRAIGNDRIMFTAIVKEWCLPRPPQVNIEAHWQHEEISLRAIKDFQTDTRADVIAILRGYSPAWLRENKLIEKIVEPAKDTFFGLAFLFPHRYLPFQPISEYRSVFENGLYPVFGDDLMLKKPSFPYLGVTAFAKRATRIK